MHTKLKRYFIKFITLVICLTSAVAVAKEYVVVGSYGNQIHIIDPLELKVVKSIRIPGIGPVPTFMAASPDGEVIYAITNQMGTLSGINLDTGEEVFQASLSIADIRSKSPYGLDISPDGKELYVSTQRVRIHPDRFEALDPKIAVYNVAAGLDAKPDRLLSSPRRVVGVAASLNGRSIYVHSYDIHELDARTGETIRVLPVASWKKENYGQPDYLNLWRLFGVSNVYIVPVYIPKTDEPGSVDVGLISIDLMTDEYALDVIEPYNVSMYSLVVNPVRRNEVYGTWGWLTKFDRNTKEILGRVKLPHNYMSINASFDGERIYLGGAICDVAIVSTEDLNILSTVSLPHCADQSLSSLLVIKRKPLDITRMSVVESLNRDERIFLAGKTEN